MLASLMIPHLSSVRRFEGAIVDPAGSNDFPVFVAFDAFDPVADFSVNGRGRGGGRRGAWECKESVGRW